MKHLIYAAAPQFAEESSGGGGGGGGGGTDICSVMTFDVPNSDSGQIVVPHGTTFDIYSSFKMNATFSNASGHSCALCSYRQEVRGYIKYKLPGQSWITYPKQLAFLKTLSADVFQEDDDPNGDPYGHRDGANKPNDAYWPAPRMTGCRYEGEDAPGLYGYPMGTLINLFLEFKGMIIAKNSTSGVPERTAYWTVQLRTF